jgi:hypothetical protein
VTSESISTPAQPFLSADLPTLLIAEPGIIVGSGRKSAMQHGRTSTRFGRPHPSLSCQHVQACDIIKTHVVQFPTSHVRYPTTELDLAYLCDETGNVGSNFRINLNQHLALLLTTLPAWPTPAVEPVQARNL